MPDFEVKDTEISRERFGRNIVPLSIHGFFDDYFESEKYSQFLEDNDVRQISFNDLLPKIYEDALRLNQKIQASNEWKGSSSEARLKNSCGCGGTNRGIISSIADADTFISTYRIRNGLFDELALGDTITINDGIYNADWVIAEFDYHCHLYSDFDKPYINKFHNIALVPAFGSLGGFYRAYTSTPDYWCAADIINKTVLPKLTTSLKTVLGDHLKPFYQYVLNLDISQYNFVNEWVQREAFLMSEYQCFGDNSIYSREEVQKYEHRFPLMERSEFGSSVKFWLRSAQGFYNKEYHFCISDNGKPNFCSDQEGTACLCPLIVLG